jgi:4-amino-4-deoxy-L-arabinose transferase-like glycosyltransferase
MSKRPSLTTGLILAGITAIAALLRVLMAARSGIWRDEGLFLAVVRLPDLGAMLVFLRDHESHPPLFYLMARAWQALVGPTDMAMLALPILFGVALSPAAYWVGARLFSERAGLAAAFALAVSPLLAEVGGQARPYSFLALLSLALAYALVRGHWVAYALLAAAALLTHNYAWVVLGGFALAALPFGRWRGLVGAHVAAAVLWAPWAPAFWQQLRHAGHAAGPITKLGTPGSMLGYVFFGLPDPWLGWAVVLGAALLVVLAARRADAERRLAYAIFMGGPAAAVAASIAGSWVTDLFLARTLMALAPCVVLAAWAACFELAQGKARWLPALPVMATAWLAFWIGTQLHAMPRSNARELAHAVAERARPTDLVVVAPEWLASSFNTYYPPTNPQLDYPALERELATPFNDVAARMGDPVAYRAALAKLAAARTANVRVWLVVDRQGLVAPAPPGEDLPPALLKDDWTLIGRARSAQLQAALRRLYGKPKGQLETPGPHSPVEDLTALLFEPSAP